MCFNPPPYLHKWKGRIEGNIINNWVRGWPAFALISLKLVNGSTWNSSWEDCRSDLNYWVTLSLCSGLKSLLLPFRMALIDVLVSTVFIVHQSIFCRLLCFWPPHIQWYIYFSSICYICTYCLSFNIHIQLNSNLIGLQYLHTMSKQNCSYYNQQVCLYWKLSLWGEWCDVRLVNWQLFIFPCAVQLLQPLLWK